MTKRATYSHDEFFRDTFANRERAINFLQHHLPPDLRALVDLSSLTIRPNSYIEQNLKGYCSDLLYHLNWAEG